MGWREAFFFYLINGDPSWQETWYGWQERAVFRVGWSSERDIKTFGKPAKL